MNRINLNNAKAGDTFADSFNNVYSYIGKMTEENTHALECLKNGNCTKYRTNGVYSSDPVKRTMPWDLVRQVNVHNINLKLFIYRTKAGTIDYHVTESDSLHKENETILEIINVERSYNL